VRDVGRAVVGPQDVNLAGWMNTEPAIIIAVQRQSGANVIATVDAIKKALPQLEASLPPSLKIHIVCRTDQSLRAGARGRARIETLKNLASGSGCRGCGYSCGAAAHFGPCVDGCAGRPAKDRRVIGQWKSVTVKE
jgi:hypothetical protein